MTLMFKDIMKIPLLQNTSSNPNKVCKEFIFKIRLYQNVHVMCTDGKQDGNRW